jgi:hypothetical protein
MAMTIKQAGWSITIYGISRPMNILLVWILLGIASSTLWLFPRNVTVKES